MGCVGAKVRGKGGGGHWWQRSSRRYVLFLMRIQMSIRGRTLIISWAAAGLFRRAEGRDFDSGRMEDVSQPSSTASVWFSDRPEAKWEEVRVHCLQLLPYDWRRVLIRLLCPGFHLTGKIEAPLTQWLMGAAKDHDLPMIFSKEARRYCYCCISVFILYSFLSYSVICVSRCKKQH